MFLAFGMLGVLSGPRLQAAMHALWVLTLGLGRGLFVGFIWSVAGLGLILYAMTHLLMTVLYVLGYPILKLWPIMPNLVVPDEKPSKAEA